MNELFELLEKMVNSSFTLWVCRLVVKMFKWLINHEEVRKQIDRVVVLLAKEYIGGIAGRLEEKHNKKNKDKEED